MEIIKIIKEINAIENRQKIKKTEKSKNDSIERKSSEIKKLVVRLIKVEKKQKHKASISAERKGTTTNLTDTKNKRIL